MFDEIEEIKELNETEKEEKHHNSPFSGLKELTKRAVENPEGAPNKYSIVELSPEVYYKVMTESRAQLLKTIKHNQDINSIKELAGMVNRRPDSISRDLKILENYGFIELIRQGKEKKPKILNGQMIVNF